MENKLIIINIGASILVTWAIFEYLVNKNNKNQLKKQLNKIVSESKNEYKDYYQINFKRIADEITSTGEDEKQHTIQCFKKTFEDRSSSNLESFIRNLDVYNSLRNSVDKNLFSEVNKENCILAIKKMLWFPYISRFFFSALNQISLYKWKRKYKIQKEYFSNTLFYIISNENSEKNLLLFIGFGGFLYPFDKVVDLFVDKGYRIIIPIYGPCQASFDFNLNCHEAEFHNILHKFLLKIDCKTLEILCWSLGGILYKGFEQHLFNFKFNNFCSHDKFIDVKKVYMIEPLIGIRACTDTFFCQKRNYNDTLDLMNLVTDKKYHFYNCVFSYFLHTVIGFSTGISFGFYACVELKQPELSIRLPRYLFVSSDDIIFNKKLDKELINTNFDKKNIYYRNGFHGGWLMSKKILPILDKIIDSK